MTKSNQQKGPYQRNGRNGLSQRGGVQFKKKGQFPRLIEQAVSRALNEKGASQRTVDGTLRPIPNEGRALIAMQKRRTKVRILNRARPKKAVDLVERKSFHPDETIVALGEMDEVERAWEEVQQYKNKIKRNREDMATYAFKYLQSGRTAGVQGYKTMDYLNKPVLTELYEDRKIKSNSVHDTSQASFYDFTYDVRSATVKNPKHAFTNAYHFETTGGNFNFKDSDKLFQFKISTHEANVFKDINLLTLETQYRHFSLLKTISAVDTQTLKNKLKSYIKDEVLSVGFWKPENTNMDSATKPVQTISDPEKEDFGKSSTAPSVNAPRPPGDDVFNQDDDAILDTISKDIVSMWAKSTAVKFPSDACIRPFDSSDYEISLCSLNGTRDFQIKDKHLRIQIIRRTVLSSLLKQVMYHSDKQYNIPLCEEIVVQVEEQVRDDEYASTAHSFVIAAHWGRGSSFVHFHGLNAFTVKMNEKDMPWGRNRYVSSMQIAGWLVQRLDSIESSNGSRLNEARGFFQRIIGNSNLQRKISSRINAKRGPSGKLPIIAEQATTPEQQIEHLKLSFLGDQSLKHLAALVRLPSSDNKAPPVFVPCFVVSEWFCSPSFSIVALSPRNDPSKTTVFCITHSVDHNVKTAQNPLQTRLTQYREADQQHVTLNQSRPRSGPIETHRRRALFSRSSLPPELELELELL